ncbi:hypothetical protein BCR33DRAFT_827038 [Rhizoclosmatium globosum]|uniref:Aminoglycoside phosphotransferase domain-containing protein n=1 Tax=Rhizoclosmatium globosum TaxID=329046 RepID=A0A1Y2C2B2_9FUNG|nr:hypothetical protein BCR33DRAFT_827038 [Rhizoclosmatium globosum]|eukprot:ORY41017.1 hypothetical protein BCR33DRAFT_827038 [Rhizoclosmatium globosum]
MSLELLQSIDPSFPSTVTDTEVSARVKTLLDSFGTSFENKSGSWDISIDKTGLNSTVFVAKHSAFNEPSLVIKHTTNPYSHKAVIREHRKLGYLLERSSSPDSDFNLDDLIIPRPLGPLVSSTADLSDEASANHTPHHHVVTCLTGINGAEAMKQCKDSQDRESLIRAFARAVKKVHAWNPGSNYPYLRLDEQFNSSFDVKTFDNTKEWLHTVMETVYRPRILPRATKLAEEGDKGAIEALEWMENLDRVLKLEDTDEFWTGVNSQIVFAHGDCMLPNFLFKRNVDTKEWVVSGVLDLGDSGYGDRRLDLGCANWSIGYNAGLALDLEGKGEEEKEVEKKALGNVFLDEYGMEIPNDGASFDVFMDFYELFDFYSYDE